MGKSKLIIYGIILAFTLIVFKHTHAKDFGNKGNNAAQSAMISFEWFNGNS